MRCAISCCGKWVSRTTATLPGTALTRGIPRVKAVPGKVAVVLETHFPQQEIAQRIGAVPLDRRAEADGGAGRLAHLRAFPLHVAVRPYQPGQLEAGAE